MSQSSLATYKRISPNCTKPRNKKIMGVAIHCTAGSPSNTARQIVDGARFVTKSDSGASCHYAVGGDGSIAQGCLEENRAWCTSHTIDHSIITIEVASDVTGKIVTNKAVDALIDLLVDICKRNGIKKLLWKADKALMGKWDLQNMVVHRWTAAKACPGDYLYNLHPVIAERVNKILNGEVKEEPMDISKFIEQITDEQAYVLLTKARKYLRTLPTAPWDEFNEAVGKGITDGTRPKDVLTREEGAVMALRAAKKEVSRCIH